MESETKCLELLVRQLKKVELQQQQSNMISGTLPTGHLSLLTIFPIYFPNSLVKFGLENVNNGNLVHSKAQ